MIMVSQMHPSQCIECFLILKCDNPAELSPLSQELISVTFFRVKGTFIPMIFYILVFGISKQNFSLDNRSGF